RRAEGDGRGSGSLHRGVSQEVRSEPGVNESMSDEREDLGRVVKDRIAKLSVLKERGIEPYAYSFDPTHSAADALALAPEGAEEGEVVRVAGRIVSRRAMGKSTFAHIADRSGRIQLYFRLNDLGDESYGILDLL